MREENAKSTVQQQPGKASKRTTELVTLNPTSEYAPGLEDTLILTMKGIAAGIQNTG
jgi:phosphoenolpyruvate carboxylase